MNDDNISWPLGAERLQPHDVLHAEGARSDAEMALKDRPLMSHICFGDPWVWAVLSTTANERRVLPVLAPSLGGGKPTPSKGFHLREIICTGSYGDGLWPFSLLDWCGLDLTDDEQDRLWAQTTDLRLLQSSAYCDWETVGETDDVPSGSDEFFEFTSGNAEKVKFDVREEVFRLIDTRSGPARGET